ncbi:MAG: ferredoxin [Pseudomonadota bacterium]
MAGVTGVAATLETAGAALAPAGLMVTGAFHPAPGEAAEGIATLCLIGAAGAAMWPAFAAGPEYADGAPDPLDRWSARVIGEAAASLGARTLFPFGGPPWQPFMAWAGRAEGAAPSPIGMMVTPARGLHASWRGALGFSGRLDLSRMPAPGPHPCPPCAAPCRTACPVDAFGEAGYDTAACAAHVRSAAGTECRERGCLARRACPASAPIAPAQAAFHLAAFVGSRPVG